MCRIIKDGKNRVHSFYPGIKTALSSLVLLGLVCSTPMIVHPGTKTMLRFEVRFGQTKRNKFHPPTYHHFQPDTTV